MVNLSDEAAGLIRSLVADSELPDSAGLRLGTDDDKHSLAMELEAAPHRDDLVLEHQGASLFVSGRVTGPGPAAARTGAPATRLLRRVSDL